MRENLVLRVAALHHSFGANRVLHDINLEIAHGQIVGLVGPSGCGKTTLLKAVIGTHPPTAGAITVFKGPNNRGQRLVTGPGRERGIVYQKYGLYPFLTTLENVVFGPRLDESSLLSRLTHPISWHRKRRQHIADAEVLLTKLGLGDAMHRYPSELSGGMQQRVAVAQALIMKPQILLLDEPFGALDEATREDLQRTLLTLYQENITAINNRQQPPYTILIVTHELNEAIYVSDRVVGLSQYWDWKGEGHTRCPGATIVYDKSCPVFHPDDDPNPEVFKAQRLEIRRVVFDTRIAEPRTKHLTFWSEVKAGTVGGVFACKT